MKLFKKDLGEEHNFWMSYTDLMSGFLVVFIIISIAMFKQYNDSRKNFEQFSGMSAEEISNKFSKMKHELDSLKGADLKNLINEYKDVFIANKNIQVSFDTKRGSIILLCMNPKDYLFAPGKSDFEPALKQYIDQIRLPLVKKTMNLWEKNNYKNVEMRIEGHTDPTPIGRGTRGDEYSFVDNLSLSSERANNVYQYILMNNDLSEKEKEFITKNMISVGYSFSTRVKEDNISDASLDASSRRIEFRIISK